MTDQTPRTEAGRFLWDEYNPDHEYELSPHVRTLILAIEAEAAAQARTEALDVDDCDSIILALEHFPTWFDRTMEKVKAYRAILAGETE